MKRIRVGLLGKSGRMGKIVAGLVRDEFGKRAEVTAVFERGGSLAPLLDTDVVIDFSSPTPMRDLIGRALAKKKGNLPKFVIGSTGWKPTDQEILRKLSKRTAVLASSNFSTGVFALLKVLEEAAPLFRKLGYSPVILETHHRHKKDAPSGTALSIQKALGQGEIHSIRAGEVVGEHSVTFYGSGDRISMTHIAQDRSIFARGAIAVALWLAQSRHTSGILALEDYFADLTTRS